MSGMNWQNVPVPETLHLECGAVVDHAVGTRVFNYYDRKAGTITRLATYPSAPTMPVHDSDGGAAFWVGVKHDDGTSADLDQSRMCSIDYAQTRGWV